MSAIFLSYRRDDSAGYAGRLFDYLAQRFGRERVFMDIETLEPGIDFVAGIDRAIASCGAVIAMIGPHWVDAQDSAGKGRLDNPNDFIRLEIKSALTRGVRVIPVLVHNARMPVEGELPEALRPLSRLQACEISDNRWDFDAGRLGDVLEPLIAGPGESQAPPPPTGADTADPEWAAGTGGGQRAGRPGAWVATAASAVLAIGAGAWWFSQSTGSDETPPATDVAVPRTSTETVPPEMAAPPDVIARPGVGDQAEEAVTTSATAAPPDPPPAPRPEKPDVATEPGQAVPESAAAQTREEAPPAPPDAGPAAVPELRMPSVDERRQGEIAALLEAAEADLAALRLTRPADDNAFERYQRVLDLDPQNRAALGGLNAIVERYRELVEATLERGAFDTAQRHLDAARGVGPDADWFTGLQREIDERRRVATRVVPDTAPPVRPEPRTPVREEAAGREACLSACERGQQDCSAAIGPRSEADCLAASERRCEARYEDCLSDASKMFMGQVSLESECIGVHIKCTRLAAEECAAAPRTAAERCDTRFDACARNCRDTE